MIDAQRSKMEKAIAALEADLTRQNGRLYLSDVIRQIERRGLSDDEALDVYQKLSDAGIRPLVPETTLSSVPTTIEEPEASRHSTDLLDLYFEDIFAERLLSAEEELLLIRQIRAGETAAAHLSAATNGQNDILKALVEAGQKARDRMLLANARLAFKIAKRFNGKSQLELFDLIQEGLIGVNRAINTFDPNRGYKFSTYAVNWIEQHIRRAIDDKGSTIRIPIHALDLLRRARRVRRALHQETGGSEPSLRAVAQYMGLKPGKLEMIELLASPTNSIDIPPAGYGREDDAIAHHIEAPQSNTLEDEIFQKELMEVIFGPNDLLPERQKIVLKLRFGFGEENDLTLDEIGKRFNLTRERIRQIESKALKRLKAILSRESGFYMGRRSAITTKQPNNSTPSSAE